MSKVTYNLALGFAVWGGVFHLIHYCCTTSQYYSIPTKPSPSQALDSFRGLCLPLAPALTGKLLMACGVLPLPPPHLSPPPPPGANREALDGFGGEDAVVLRQVTPLPPPVSPPLFLFPSLLTGKLLMASGVRMR